MQTIQIQKIEIGEKFVTIQYAKPETRQGISELLKTKRKFPFNIHDELKEALKNLVPHFALLTESTKLKGIIDGIERLKEIGEIEAIEVTGFELKRQGDSEGVIIYGHRKLKDDRTVKFNTPFINFDVEISDYDFVEQLNAHIDIAKQEAIEYINGKFKIQGTQLGLMDTPEEIPVKKLSNKKNSDSRAA